MKSTVFRFHSFLLLIHIFDCANSTEFLLYLSLLSQVCHQVSEGKVSAICCSLSSNEFCFCLLWCVARNFFCPLLQIALFLFLFPVLLENCFMFLKIYIPNLAMMSVLGCDFTSLCS